VDCRFPCVGEGTKDFYYQLKAWGGSASNSARVDCLGTDKESITVPLRRERGDERPPQPERKIKRGKETNKSARKGGGGGRKGHMSSGNVTRESKTETTGRKDFTQGFERNWVRRGESIHSIQSASPSNAGNRKIASIAISDRGRSAREGASPNWRSRIEKWKGGQRKEISLWKRSAKDS